MFRQTDTDFSKAPQQPLLCNKPVDYRSYWCNNYFIFHHQYATTMSKRDRRSLCLFIHGMCTDHLSKGGAKGCQAGDGEDIQGRLRRLSFHTEVNSAVPTEAIMKLSIFITFCALFYLTGKNSLSQTHIHAHIFTESQCQCVLRKFLQDSLQYAYITD